MVGKFRTILSCGKGAAKYWQQLQLINYEISGLVPILPLILPVRLELQVGILAARDLVQINISVSRPGIFVNS